MKFSDFENKQDLVGKTVLYVSGISFSQSKKLSIMRIEKVTKTGFRLFLMPNVLFSFDGYQKGLNSRSDMAIISKCELITEEKVDQLRQQWGLIKRKES